jgi:hypothetical protein
MLRELDDELSTLDPAFAARPTGLNALNGRPSDAGTGKIRDRQEPGGGRGTRPASAGVARDTSQVNPAPCTLNSAPCTLHPEP